LGNAWTYDCLLDARRSAVVYLNTLASEYSEAAVELGKAAELYRIVSDTLEETWAARNAWQEDVELWKAEETRRRQADTLQRAMESEQDAVKALRAAVAKLERSPS
jgi:hypothetical protein